MYRSLHGFPPFLQTDQTISVAQIRRHIKKRITKLICTITTYTRSDSDFRLHFKMKWRIEKYEINAAPTDIL